MGAIADLAGGSTRRERVALALVLAGECALALLDVQIGPHAILTGLFVVGPFVLAAYGPPRHVAHVGAFAVALSLASGLWDHYFLSLDHVIRCGAVALGSALAVLASRARRRSELARDAVECIARELEVGRTQFEGMLGVLAEAVTVNEADGRFLFANAAALELMGVGTLEDLLSTPADLLFAHFDSWHEDGTPVSASELPGRRLLRGEHPEPLLIRRVDRATGAHRWLLLKAAQLEWRDESAVAVNVIEDLTETKERELHERFLADAGELLAASSLDFDETLRAVARLAVPTLADWCAVEVAEERGHSRQLAAAHADPAKLAMVEELRERYPPQVDAERGVGMVLRTGLAELYPTITDELLEQTSVDDDQLRLARALAIRSAMIVPMRARGHTVGAIMFVTGETLRPYGDRDLVFAQELATRAGTALDNARVHRERSDAADTLQRSLLPARLPPLDGWMSATLYRPADEGNRIGGDFFDVFTVDDGFVVLLGDVTGKGVTAAALTALARHSAKTAAMLGLPPGGVLALLNRMLLDQPRRSLVTALCAKVTERPGGATVTLASGGHPLPLRYRSGEEAVELGEHGLTLGWRSEPVWPQTTHALEPGDGLLLYTDGVTDTPGAEDRFGDLRLRRLLSEIHGDPQVVVDGIDAALRSFQARPVVDDIAIVALSMIAQHAVTTPSLPSKAPAARAPRSRASHEGSAPAMRHR